MKDGAKNKTIAKKYGITPLEVSALKTALEKHRNLDSLVEMPQPDKAIPINETFLKVERKNVYIIISTHNTPRKVLEIKVSFNMRR